MLPTRALLPALAILALACRDTPRGDSSPATDSARLTATELDSAAVTHVGDSGGALPEHVAGDTSDDEASSSDEALLGDRAPHLTPLADSIARTMVFMVKERSSFVAAVRAKRLLLDLGRVDAKIKSAADRAAYASAVDALSPVKPGDRFRLHGPWGADDATVGGFDQWNGRIVATLTLPPRLDTVARRSKTLIVAATPADSALPSVVDSCPDDPVDSLVDARLIVLRDSLSILLRADTLHLLERLKRSLKDQSSSVVGCFGTARVLLIVGVYAGDFEYVKQVAMLVDTTGTATPVRLSDLRFKAHDVLEALDIDGDGVDDIATRGRAERIGGTSLLRYNPARNRFEYVTSGFAWEGL